MANILLNWSQGGWTTYNPNNAPGVINNIQRVDYFDATLRISKEISLRHFTVQLFADVSNLFNALRLRTDNDQDYRASLHLPVSKAYPNIPGDDKFGDYRTPGVDWQPEVIQPVQRSDGSFVPAPGDYRAFYYDGNTKKFWKVVNDPVAGNTWTLVDQATIDKINKDKAYISMPNPSTYWFLNPRNITFGLRVSFDVD